MRPGPCRTAVEKEVTNPLRANAQTTTPSAQAKPSSRYPPALFRLTNGPKGPPPWVRGTLQYSRPLKVNNWARPKNAIVVALIATPRQSQRELRRLAKKVAPKTKPEIARAKRARSARVEAG